MKATLCLATLVLIVTAASARADCLDDVAEFADKICAGIKAIGKSNLVNRDGEINAAAKSLITTAVGELRNGDGAANARYEKVLQEQLSAERTSRSKCGIALAKTAIDEVCFKAR